MIIKYYTHAFPTVIHILENVTDIRIDKNIYPLGTIGSLQSSSPSSVYTFGDEFEGKPVLPVGEPVGNCFIDFTRNGVHSRLLVSNFAYVCNDEGKPIEKVSAV